MPVIGEPFKEVSPGFLPRTLDQLRAGVENDATRPENRLRRRRLSSEEERPEEPQQSLESALDSLLAEASDDETPRPSEETIPPVVEPAQPAQQPRPVNRGEARLQRARERFARVFGTREDIQQEDYESPLSTMYNRAYDRYRQAEERRATDTTAPPPLDGLSPQERREIEEQLLWGVMRDSATHDELDSEDNVWSYAPRRAPIERSDFSDSASPPPIYGSFIEWQAANGARFLRSGSETAETSLRAASHRYRPTAPTTPTTTAGPSPPLTFTASSTVPSTTTAGPSQPTSSATVPAGLRRDQSLLLERTADFERLRHQFELIEESERELERRNNQTLASSSSAAAEPNQSSSSSSGGNGMSQIQTSIQQITSELQRLRLASEAITSARHSMHSRFTHIERPVHTLDNQPGRPAPSTDEEMTKTLSCQVCYQQLADIAVLPCGHMVMCQWCADVVVPVKHSHLPIRPSKCPMCRKLVKQRFKIHMGS